MTPRTLWAVVLVACVFFSAGTAPARAARTVVRPETFEFEAEIPTKDGWAAFLRADGHRRVELFIHHYGEEVRPYLTMSYKVPGRVDRHGIRADFGRFGSIHLDFPSRPKRQLFPFPNCKGSKPEVNQYGEMHGRIEFESLGGLIGFEGSQVEGQTRHSPRRTCVPKPSQIRLRGDGSADRRRERGETEFSIQTFLARGHLRGRTVDLYSISLEDEIVDLAATSTRRFGAVLVQTSIHAPESEESETGEAVDFSVFGSGPRPKAADLEVAPPFSGSAQYRTQADGPPSWLGDLAVQMPGEGKLPLAGPEFRAALCGYLDTQRQRACEGVIASPHLAQAGRRMGRARR